MLREDRLCLVTEFASDGFDADFQDIMLMCESADSSEGLFTKVINKLKELCRKVKEALFGKVVEKQIEQIDMSEEVEDEPEKINKFTKFIAAISRIIKMPFEKLAAFIKNHPGGTAAIVAGIGLTALSIKKGPDVVKNISDKRSADRAKNKTTKDKYLKCFRRANDEIDVLETQIDSLHKWNIKKKKELEKELAGKQKKADMFKAQMESMDKIPSVFSYILGELKSWAKWLLSKICSKSSKSEDK